jgi:hypothetical protein
MKGGSILANFRLRKMEQNATQGRLEHERKRQEENRAFFEEQRRQENAWIAEQERERQERAQYEQRVLNLRLRHERLINNLHENHKRPTKKNRKKLYRYSGTSRNLRRAVPQLPNTFVWNWK